MATRTIVFVYGVACYVMFLGVFLYAVGFVGNLFQYAEVLSSFKSMDSEADGSLGGMIAFWATPTMSVAHLMFALVTTAYMLVAIQLEERDLVSFLGEDYVQYRTRVPMLIPRLFKRDSR